MHGWRHLGLFSLVLLLAACGATSDAQGVVSTPITSEDALRTDAERYAQDVGVPLDETVHRLSHQDEIGRLGATLEHQEADTFAGLWIQHEPQYRIVVAFTRDGEETIRPYVTDTQLEHLIEIRTAQVSYRQLQELQHEIQRLLEQAGIFSASSINVPHNQIEVYVTDPSFFQTTLAQAQIVLPEHVTAITVYEPLGDPPPFEVNADPSIHFPQLKMARAAMMEALLEGTLIVEQGCLRVRGNGNEQGHLIVWQPDWFLHRNGDTLEILDRSGKPVARVGEQVLVGGGEVPPGPSIEQQLREPIPESCRGPLWLMGKLEAAQ